MQLESKQQPTWQKIATAGIVAAALAMAANAASAGECPAVSRVADGKGQQAARRSRRTSPTSCARPPTLRREPAMIADRQFRLRQLEMQPGGVVPWHSHDNRPAMIYVVSGEVVEYASNCAVPIVHKAGDVAPEKNGTSHWWKNTGNTTAVLISVDLFPVGMKMDDHMM